MSLLSVETRDFLLLQKAAAERPPAPRKQVDLPPRILIAIHSHKREFFSTCRAENVSLTIQTHMLVWEKRRLLLINASSEGPVLGAVSDRNRQEGSGCLGG